VEALLAVNILAGTNLLHFFGGGGLKTNQAYGLGVCLLNEIVVVVHLLGVVGGGELDDTVLDAAGHVDQTSD
jgi:hypothetical protein